MLNIREDINHSEKGRGNFNLVEKIKIKIKESSESPNKTPNKKIVNGILSIKGIVKGKHIGSSKAKIDARIEETGILVLIGTNDIIYKRLLSAYHKYKMGEIKSIIIICDSDNESWWKENENKIIKKAGNGNRANFQDIKNILSSIEDWYSMDYHVLILERNISKSEHEYFLH